MRTHTTNQPANTAFRANCTNKSSTRHMGQYTITTVYPLQGMSKYYIVFVTCINIKASAVAKYGGEIVVSIYAKHGGEINILFTAEVFLLLSELMVEGGKKDRICELNYSQFWRQCYQKVLNYFPTQKREISPISDMLTFAASNYAMSKDLKSLKMLSSMV